MTNHRHESLIKDAISKLHQSRASGRKAWTKRVKDVFTEYCPKTMEAYHSLLPGRPEYLVDLVWSKPSERDKDCDWHQYGGLGLALECEWRAGLEGFWEDFIKLADVRAESRVFITQQPNTIFNLFQIKDGAQHRNILTFLRHHQFFMPSDSVYLVMWNNGNDDELIFRRYQKKGFNDLKVGAR